MAYIDKDELQDYPFSGTFYRAVKNTSSLLNPTEEEVVAEVVCDIQKHSGVLVSNVAKAVYDVYVPFDSESDIVPVQRGMMFRGEQYGLLVSGRVTGVFPMQVGTFENYTERGGDVVPHQCRGYLAIVEATDV